MFANHHMKLKAPSSSAAEEPLLDIDLPGVKKVKTGKVREMFDLGEIGKAFVILFAVIDIVGGIPMILQVRQKAGRIYPLRAMLVSLGIMVVFLFVGEQLLGDTGVFEMKSFCGHC